MTKKPSGFVILVAVIVAAAFLVGAGFLGAYLALAKLPQSTTTSVVYRDLTADKEEFANIGYTGKELTGEQVAAFAKQSVVEVVTESVTYAGFGGAYITSGAGSGVIISDSGHILTNYHVIEGAEKITVTLSDGSETEAAWVMGDEVTDIAVIKINAVTENAAVLGDSSALAAGQRVLAVGKPLGDLGGSVSAGIVSAVDREVSIDGHRMTLIQLDAAVNPGNSGGGLFDMRGEVLEFNEITGITISRPTPGLYLYSASVDTDIPYGSLIVAVDGQTIKTIDEWKAILNSKKVGETVEIEYYSSPLRSGTWRLTLTQRYGYDT